MEVRDDRAVRFDQGEQFVKEHLNLKCQGNHVVDEWVVGRHADPVVFPQQVLHHVERFVFNNAWVEEHNAWSARDEPFSIMHVVTLSAKSRCGLAKDIRGLIERLEFRLNPASGVWSQHTVIRAPVVDHGGDLRSEEHTSELQSRENLVCRLLLEKKNRRNLPITIMPVFQDMFA